MVKNQKFRDRVQGIHSALVALCSYSLRVPQQIFPRPKAICDLCLHCGGDSERLVNPHEVVVEEV